jgi:two-component system, OmpR family, response regulator
MSDIDLRLLIVDDDDAIRALLKDFFGAHGVDVTGAREGARMFEALAAGGFDLVLVDVMLPDGSGIELCRRLRRSSALPVILLTAVSETTERITGLDVGADDYVTKPFDPSELLARVRAVLRRSSKTRPDGTRLRFEGWEIDLARRSLFDPSRAFIELTSSEFDLLAVLVQQPHTVLSRDRLVDLTFGRTSTLAGRSVDVLMSRLRRKLEQGGEDGRLIRTVRNEGYVFVAAVAPAGP